MSDSSNLKIITKASQIMAFLVGGFSVILGLAVMLAWHTHFSALLQILTDSPPICYNTALAFSLNGWALLALMKRWRRLAAGLSLLVILISGLTLAEYIFQVNFGIDQLFIQDYLTDSLPKSNSTLKISEPIHQFLIKVDSPLPGRSSPNTALGLTLLGLGTLCLCEITTRRRLLIVAGLSSAAAIAIGFVTLLGYLSDAITDYKWGYLTGVAVPTAIGLLMVGVSLQLIAFGRVDRLPQWFAFSIGFGVLTANLFLWEAINSCKNILIKQLSNITDEVELLLSPVASLVLLEGLILSLLVTLGLYFAQLAWQQATKLKETNHHLLEFNSLLQATLESTADGILVLDAEGQTTNFNTQFMQMWQVPDSALKTMKWGQEQPMLSFLASQLQNPEAFLLATKQMFNRPNYETYDVWEFQHGRVFELYTRPQWISDRPVGRVFSFRDITKRLHAESALKESEERLQLSLEGSGDGLWDWKILTDEVYFSPRWLEMLGYSVGELPGNINTWQGLIHPEDQPWVMETLNTHFQDSEHPYNFDYRVLTKSGQWKWIANYGKVVTRDRHGNPMRMAGTHKDISLRKQMEEALFYEKELAQVTLHSIGDAVITTDAMGKIEYFNPVAEMLTGWNQQEAQGLPLIEVFRIFHETTREPAENPVEKALKSGQIVGLANHTVLMTRDHSEIAIDDSAAPIRDRYNQIVGAVMVFHDVTQNRNLSRQLSWQASHDSLTGLVNRHEFEQSLEQAVISARTQNLQHALCYLDLDQFKIVNDTCGHAAGDELLRQVTTLLQTKIRQTDVLARLGGDEFGVLLYQCSLEKAIGVSNILRETIQEFRFVWQDNVFSIGVSIGLVEIKADSENRVNLLSHADAACYAAKNKGRNRVHIFQSDDEELLQQRGEMQWVGRINKALAENRFCLYSQPIAAITSTATPENHYEILLRLRDEKGNIVAPMAFIPAAERYNLMPTIDRWVISTLFKHWSLVANDSKTIYAINLSGTSINDEKFIDFLHQQFSLYQVPPELICFEITETVAITNLTKASQFIRELQQCGCRFALDDFGSGMSSFAYLKTLPVDYLKIDGGFVKNIIENSVDDAMVEAITRIGHVMGLKMIAEFVENDAILQRVKALGVDYAQGFGVAKAHPLVLN